MKKIIFALGILMGCVTGMGQAVETLFTEDGTFIKYVTTDGKDMIKLSAVQWESIARDLNISAELSDFSICIRIATRPRCTDGIGFRCGIFDCKPFPKPFVNAAQRICSVTISKQKDGSAEMVFNYPVDWTDLSN